MASIAESVISQIQKETRKRPFYGWYVVAAASVQGMFGNGTVSNGFSIFFQSIRTDLGVNYTAMALVFSLSRAEGGLGGPLVGWLVDRFGARRMILIGGITAGIGLILVSQAREYWQFILLFVGVVSVGKTAGLGQTLMAVVNQWFVRRKGVALSTLMTSFAGGGAIVVPLLGLGIGTIGWRATLMYAGIFIICITIPVAKVIRSRPEDIGLGPDGDPMESDTPLDIVQGEEGASKAIESPKLGPDFTVREAIKTSAFWLLLLGLTIRVSATNAIVIHIFPILEEQGFGEQQAAFFVSAMFFIAIPLRFGMGVAGDYLSPRKILFVGMNGAALGLLALYMLHGMTAVVLFIIGFSLVEGVTSVNWLMVGNYFGRRRFASIMGFMSMFHNTGMVISPLFSGWIKDTTGSYDIVMLTFIPIFVIGALAFTLARKPVHPSITRVATTLPIVKT
ncbi:MAG: MFS transporter [Chloroflexi bacterium]|nr:MFS transporter [Chloroflexota bacterium]